MTRRETQKLLNMIIDTYPKFISNPRESMLDTWHGLLSDMPFEKALKHLNEYLATKEFPPTIKDIRRGYIDWANFKPDLKKPWIIKPIDLMTKEEMEAAHGKHNKDDDLGAYEYLRDEYLKCFSNE